jgi:uncharacterized protein
MVRVMPRASRSGIAGVRDGALLIRLQSPPVEGAANEDLVQLVAKTFRIAKGAVAIVAGEHSRLKRVSIETIDRDQFDAVLQSLGINSEDLNVSLCPP